MNYITSNFGKAIVHFGLEKEESEYSVKTYLNNLAMKNLFTIDGYNKAVRKMLNIKSKAPIYFSDCLLIVPIDGLKKDKGIYLNYFNILSIYKMGIKTEIIFNNLDSLVINKPYKTVIQAMKKSENVINYINLVKNITLS